MYLLDTNVVSELRKVGHRIDERVSDWSHSVEPAQLFLSSVTVLEIEIGVLQMERRDPRQGKRLRHWMDTAVMTAFAGRIIPFGHDIALRAAQLHVPNPRPTQDSIIAATALIHRMTVVTRNVADFAPMGVALLNPWEAPEPFGSG
jgi:hypothetical protein